MFHRRQKLADPNAPNDWVISFGIDLGASRGSKAKKFYVYVHKDRDGNVFYVGKGTGRRAWATGGRHVLWQYYVERLNGKFDVEIVADGLQEDEAAYLEGDLMAMYGGQLVMTCPHERYHSLC